MGRFDRLALLVTTLALLGWIIIPGNLPVGIGLATAGALLVLRLARWRGHRAWREPIVLVLHLGYAWLAVSLVLLGAAGLLPETFPSASAIHALTAGAVGTMTLAVMTRASLGHTGRAIVADGTTLAIYILVTVGALLRVAAPLFAQQYLSLLVFGGAAWSSAFALFVIRYGVPLLTPRVNP
jgi:uncharacterized protein involved in response to NO